MFGYMEGPYRVIKAASLTVRNGTQHFELRQSTSSGASYLALTGKDAGGRQTFDYLLFYDDPATLEVDWERLVSDEKVAISALGWSQKIVDHHIGYGRDGSLTMY